MSDETAGVTHHEAGHTVAALMTVHGEVGDHVGVRLDARRGVGTSHLTPPTGCPVHAALIFYAGPWAEARVQWGKPVHTLDDTNDDGMPFRGMVKAAFDDATDVGGTSDRTAYAEYVSADPSIPDNEQYWSGELERAWPVIEKLADALMDRLETHDSPLAAIDPNRKTQIASMSGHEVVGLVKPLLEACGMWRYLS
jgi:hypothetical protein